VTRGTTLKRPKQVDVKGHAGHWSKGWLFHWCRASDKLQMRGVLMQFSSRIRSTMAYIHVVLHVCGRRADTSHKPTTPPWAPAPTTTLLPQPLSKHAYNDAKAAVGAYLVSSCPQLLDRVGVDRGDLKISTINTPDQRSTPTLPPLSGRTTHPAPRHPRHPAGFYSLVTPKRMSRSRGTPCKPIGRAQHPCTFASRPSRFLFATFA
jgi:hypothetical protein